MKLFFLLIRLHTWKKKQKIVKLIHFSFYSELKKLTDSPEKKKSVTYSTVHYTYTDYELWSIAINQIKLDVRHTNRREKLSFIYLFVLLLLLLYSIKSVWFWRLFVFQCRSCFWGTQSFRLTHSCLSHNASSKCVLTLNTR